MSDDSSSHLKPQNSPLLASGGYVSPALDGNDDAFKPDMLRNTLRADLFPQIQENLVKTGKGIVMNQTMREIYSYESRRVTDKCPNFKIVSVEEAASPSSVPSFPPWGFFQSGATSIGAETWRVDRCGSEYTYRVDYWRHASGDHYYKCVTPTTAQGLWDFFKRKSAIFREHFFRA